MQNSNRDFFFEKQDLKLALLFYLLKNIPHKIIRNKSFNNNTGTLWIGITKRYNTYLSLHYRFMVFLGLSQLVDIFNYEKIEKFTTSFEYEHKTISNTIIYNFHNFLNRRRYFLVVTQKNKSSVSAISNIFISARWLERELSEMSGISLKFAFDCRPLLLDYSTLINPLLKCVSVIGVSELVFDICTGSISRK